MTRKKIYSEAFVPTELRWINSEAYKALPARGHKALPLFQAKVKIPLGNPQRHMEVFTLDHSELHRATSMSGKTCSDAIGDLIRFGLIDLAVKGGLKSFGKGSNKYKLSRRWEHYGKPSFIKIDRKTHIP